MALLLVAALAAPQAGRVGEASGLDFQISSQLAISESSPQLCSQTASLEARELVFETVEPGELDSDEIRRLTSGAREVVNFKWNAATGELTYDTSAPTGVFSDLVSSSQISVGSHPICESR